MTTRGHRRPGRHDTGASHSSVYGHINRSHACGHHPHRSMTTSLNLVIPWDNPCIPCYRDLCSYRTSRQKHKEPSTPDCVCGGWTWLQRVSYFDPFTFLAKPRLEAAPPGYGGWKPQCISPSLFGVPTRFPCQKKTINPLTELLHQDREIDILAGGGLDLGGGALGALLADDAAGLALAGGGVLGLLGLLGGVGLGLLVLGLLDGGGAGGGAGLGAHGALLLDHIEGGTDDGTLGLDGAAGALLGDLLRGESAICIGVKDEGRHTSEIPLRCWRRYRTVHEMRRGFLRWRKRDSDLPFWKRKILLSPRT